MIRIDQLPEKAIDAARLAMAEALARDGDGIPECIVAALNKWPGRLVATSGAVILPLTENPDAEA